MNYDVKDMGLAELGARRAEWASREMKVLESIKQRFVKERPLEGVTIAGCLHVTSETANLATTLKAGGAEVVMCASNPLSTQDDIAAYLVKEGISTFAIHGADDDTYYRHINSALDAAPQVTIDDGADLVATLHKSRRDLLPNVVGGMEETTTGIIRLRAMSADGRLEYPIIAVNDSDTKHLFDNRYGTGQSTIDGILRATNILLAGRTVVVIGYGWCGRGISSRARGMGAHTIVTDVDPVKALEAVMDGHRVMPLLDAVKQADIVISATGNKHVIDEAHIMQLKDGACIANSGHFNVEINIGALESNSNSKRTVRTSVEEYSMKDGRLLFLLGQGRLINLAAAEGHPASVMDMSFANQALGSEYIHKNSSKLDPGVHNLPPAVDKMIASIKLESMKVKFDSLTEEQTKYLSSWEEGT